MKPLQALSNRIARLFSARTRRSWFAAPAQRRRQRTWQLSAGIECLEDRRLLTSAYTPEILSNGDGVAGDGALGVNGNRDLADSTVGVASNGNYVVAFEYRFSLTDTDIYFQRYEPDGSRLGTHVDVARTGAQERNPEIAVAQNGAFVVVYEKVVSGQSLIYMQGFLADGTRVLNETLVSDSADGNQINPDIAISDRNEFVIVWEDEESGTGNDLEIKRYNPDFTLKNQFRSVVEGTTQLSFTTPSIAIEPDSGNIVVAYDLLNLSTANHDIFFFRLSPTNAVLQGQTPVLGAAEAQDREISPSVAINSAGEFIIGWTNDRSGDFQTLATKYNAAGGSPNAQLTGAGLDVKVAVNDVDDTWIIARRGFNSGITYRVYNSALTSTELGDQNFQSSTEFRDLNIGANFKGDFVVVGTNINTSPDTISGFGRTVTLDFDDQISEAINIGDVTTQKQFSAALINPATDVDIFAITVGNGQKVTIETGPSGEATVDTFLRLFNSSGTQLATDDDGAGNGYSRLTHTFNIAGTYYVGVSSIFNSTYNPITGDGDTSGGSNPTGSYFIRFTPPAVPVAVADNYTLGSFQGNSSSDFSVFTNDTNTSGRVAVLIQGPQLGTVNLQANGNFTYTPSTAPGSDFWGRDTFTYRIAGGGGQPGNTVTVTLLTHNAVQIRKLYMKVLNREPDLAGWEAFTRQINNNSRTLGDLASDVFLSDERLDPIIRQYYTDYLFREADAGGLFGWKDIFRTTGGPEQVIAGIVASPEFFQSVGSNNQNFVTQLYVRLLNRQPDQAGLAHNANLLNNGTLNRFQLVLGFVTSLEERQNEIRRVYQLYLERLPSQQDLDVLAAALLNGTSRKDIQIGLINSAEFFNNPLPPAMGTAMRS